MAFASGRHALGLCDRCGFRYKLSELKTLVIKTQNVEIKVCPECWEPDQPQLQVGMYPVIDPQALEDPRPDTGYYISGGGDRDGSRIIEWGWNPVGGASSFDSVLTPNALKAVGSVGDVTISIT